MRQPMTTPEINEMNRTERKFLLCAIGDSVTRFPSDLVSSVGFATEAALIPFGTLPIEGLVINEEGACLQLDVGSLWGTKNKSGKYSVNIQTSKGVVSLRVDSVHTNSALNDQDDLAELLCLNAIEELVTHCDTPVEKSEIKLKQAATTHNSRSIALCQIANRVVGLYSDDISFIEHPVKFHPIRTPHQFECLVELEDGELMNGIDLYALLGIENSPVEGAKKWAIGIQSHDERFALVTEQLLGLEQHDISHFQRLHHSVTESCWLKHGQHGLVEVFDPRTFGRNQTTAVEQNEVRVTATNHPPSAQAMDTRGVGINCNQFDLVLPSVAVKSVGKVVELSDLKNKPTKNSIPAYDITKLFADETVVNGNKKRLITFKYSPKRNFALLVTDVYKPKSGSMWTVPHILPKPLGKLIKATQISDGRCELLLRDEFISELSAPEFDKFKKESFCGWLTPL
jgi:hypothetical protein